MHEMILINLSNSFLIGVSPASAVSAKFAIYPIIVLSPMLKTIPFPFPLLQRVPKNATFFVSKIFSGSLQSTDLNKGSDSPVKEELSTFISSEEIILMSAGILSPILTSIKSPVTNFAA